MQIKHGDAESRRTHGGEPVNRACADRDRESRERKHHQLRTCLRSRLSRSLSPAEGRRHRLVSSVRLRATVSP